MRIEIIDMVQDSNGVYYMPKLIEGEVDTELYKFRSFLKKVNFNAKNINQKETLEV